MIKNECAFHGESRAGAGSSGLEESYQGLITAVIRQAVKDYVSVLLRLFSCPAGKKKAALEMEKAELEVFLHSDSSCPLPQRRAPAAFCAGGETLLPFLLSFALLLGKLILAYAAERAYKVLRNILPLGARRNAVLRRALLLVILPAANLAYIFHLFVLLSSVWRVFHAIQLYPQGVSSVWRVFHAIQLYPQGCFLCLACFSRHSFTPGKGVLFRAESICQSRDPG